MAEKRMFTGRITNSDFFKELPISAQALYFHLGMNADDEGFLNNAKSIQRSILASDDDMDMLVEKKFIYRFPSGVVAIKHWKMHNTIQPSRLKATQYTEERSLLEVKENNSYTLKQQNVDNLPTNRQQNVGTCCQNGAEIRLDEIRLDEFSLEEDVPDSDEPEPPAPKEPEKPKKAKKKKEPKEPEEPKREHGEYKHVLLTDTEYEKLAKDFGSEMRDKAIVFLDEYMEEKKKYKSQSHYLAIRRWVIDAVKEKEEKQNRGRKEIVPSWMNKGSFNNYDQRQYDNSEMSDLERKMMQKTAGNNPDIAARAEALKKQLS